MSNIYKRYISFHRLNVFLSWIVVVACGYLIGFPYLPEFTYAASHAFGSVTYYHATIDLSIPAPLLPEVAAGSRVLYIPSIDVMQTIIDATDIKEVHENVWHRPGTSTPEAGSNTVLAAHRYATIGGVHGSTFYNLPKVAIGDPIYIAWDGAVYVYEAKETKVVPASEIAIEAPTEEAMLTLYTCTPLWSATNRFVTQARLLTTVSQ